MSQLEAVFDYVIIEPIKENQERFGQIVIADMGKEKPIKGKVISVGPGRYSVTGNLLPTQINVGDIVYLPKMGPIVIEHEGVEYYSCQESIIQAKVNE